VRKARRVHLLFDGRIGETEHGVIGVENLQLLASFLELLDVDEDGVTRRSRDVGDVQQL